MPKVEIDQTKCKGCEYCVFVCPKNVLGLSDEINSRGIRPILVLKPESCTGCTLCAVVCPDACIEIWK
jgi:2-oxoglutarate ferredoxin oxidoreductase subunit delta